MYESTCACPKTCDGVGLKGSLRRVGRLYMYVYKPRWCKRPLCLLLDHVVGRWVVGIKGERDRACVLWTGRARGVRRV